MLKELLAKHEKTQTLCFTGHRPERLPQGADMLQMQERLSEAIAYYDGGSGGTAYTVNRAIKKGLTVHNLYEGGGKETTEEYLRQIILGKYSAPIPPADAAEKIAAFAAKG
ncbi:MAG: hypothetical protein LBJ21_05285 [Acidobacteriota bacterium]|jgi:hypothetical protein|nr:hypothetical protein [Acidobacteriota bacterium]